MVAAGRGDYHDFTEAALAWQMDGPGLNVPGRLPAARWTLALRLEISSAMVAAESSLLQLVDPCANHSI